YTTLFRSAILLSDRQYCELYAKVRLDMPEFRAKKCGGPGKLLGTEPRNVANNLRDTAYFVNAHHARKFEKAFPSLWRLMNCGVGNPMELNRVIAFVRGIAPTTYQSLVATGIL